MADLSIKGIDDKEYAKLRIEALRAGLKFRPFIMQRLGLTVKVEKKAKVSK